MPRPGLLSSMALCAMGACLAACIDATHDDQVAALGGEAPGVSPGPEHRPGQPCLVCHGGLGPASSTFSLGGTVVAVIDQTAPAVGAQVQIEDINGVAFLSPTNGAGNFYVTTGQWQPTFPIKMQVTLGGTTAQMVTFSGRDGSCAACHQASVGPSSPGPVYVATTAGQLQSDGGTSE